MPRCRLILLCRAFAVISSVSLAAELDLLLHLIALPPGISCQSSADALHQQQPTFSTGAVAVLYAAQVLSLSGTLHCFLHPSYLSSACRPTAQAVSLLTSLATADMHTSML